ncbi:hypothetical protein [Streptomyces sp. NPDC006446]|uniref:hypothetical protein n=1 Tax=Streptomyces sp. NPDC006446 TaxID=3154301 RepID=UPI0033AE8A4E
MPQEKRAGARLWPTALGLFAVVTSLTIKAITESNESQRTFTIACLVLASLSTGFALGRLKGQQKDSVRSSEIVQGSDTST